jgi:hypothetical protein
MERDCIIGKRPVSITAMRNLGVRRGRCSSRPDDSGGYKMVLWLTIAIATIMGMANKHVVNFVRADEEEVDFCAKPCVPGDEAIMNRKEHGMLYPKQSSVREISFFLTLPI